MPRVIEKTVYQFEELSDEAKEKAREWYREGLGYDEWWQTTYEDTAHTLALVGIYIYQKPVKLMGGGTRYDPEIYFELHCQGAGAQFAGRYEYPNTYSLDYRKALSEAGFSEPEINRSRKRSPAAWVAAYAPETVLRCNNGKCKTMRLPKRIKPGQTCPCCKEGIVVVEVQDGNKRLNDAVRQLQDLQKANGYGLTARIKTSGHRGCHENATEIDVFKTNRLGDEVELDTDTEDGVCEALRDLMRWVYFQLEAEWEWQNSDEVVDDNIMVNEYEFDEDGRRAR